MILRKVQGELLSGVTHNLFLEFYFILLLPAPFIFYIWFLSMHSINFLSNYE